MQQTLTETLKLTGPQWDPWRILSPRNRKHTGREHATLGETGARIVWRRGRAYIVLLGGKVSAVWCPDPAGRPVPGIPKDHDGSAPTILDSPTGLPVDADLTEGPNDYGRLPADRLATGRIEWTPDTQGCILAEAGHYQIGPAFTPGLEATGETTAGGTVYSPYAHEHGAQVRRMAETMIGWRNDMAAEGQSTIHLDAPTARTLIQWTRRLRKEHPGAQVRITTPAEYEAPRAQAILEGRELEGIQLELEAPQHRAVGASLTVDPARLALAIQTLGKPEGVLLEHGPNGQLWASAWSTGPRYSVAAVIQGSTYSPRR